ncbi:Trimethyltridecatetraene synthase [Sesamum alatum]|uniref:Trimethyltridecatetraene synthase n=1 Tax=Sesamum alatum TaxID=300844 RepID=A0AAE2CY91_9LAMI|nr:Trimethyltridecatetraene synthase [Sesamum alatum]
METQIWSACLGLLVFVYLLAKTLQRRKLNLPPGPKPWPVIGNLNLIGSLPHKSLHELAQKYGPLIHLQFGSCPVVVGSSAEMAKVILKTMDVNFSCRPQTAAGKYTTYNYSDMTWSPYGPYLKQARKMCLTELFSAKRLESYEYIRVEEINSMIKKPVQSLGSTRFAEGIYVHSDPERDQPHGSGEEVPGQRQRERGGFAGGVQENAGRADLSERGDQRGGCDSLAQFLGFAGARRKSVEGYVSRDMVDVLLEQAEDPTLEVKMERHNVKALTQDLLAGGTESSAVTVEWAMSEILKKPKILKKATEELDRVIGQNKWVQEKDMSNLPYIEAIVKETMRLHPVAPLLMPRRTREDCKVAGYDIKKGTQVFVNTWTIGTDPSLWENPTEFNPERFIENAIDAKGHHFEFLPFGSGRRMCPAYSLGMKVIQSSLANLLHGFNWKLPNRMQPEDLNMDEVFGLSCPRKIPLVAVVEPRLPPEVYNL